jgi:uncharacterized BrkB/YihY/UPF0761 family membrane protein
LPSFFFFLTSILVFMLALKYTQIQACLEYLPWLLRAVVSMLSACFSRVPRNPRNIRTYIGMGMFCVAFGALIGTPSAVYPSMADSDRHLCLVEW